MSLRFARPVSALAIVFMAAIDVLATCGGGGGGGTGGMGGMGGGSVETVYPVSWKVVSSADALEPGGLVVYWFPASTNELEKSSLRNSRTLTLYATQCVTMAVVDASTPFGQKMVADEKLPVAILAQSDGKMLGKAQGQDGKLKVGQVEKLVDGEMKQREAAVKTALNAAKDAAKHGDKDTAIAQYKSIGDQKCLFPKQWKDATNELKKLGVEGLEPVPPAPNFDLVIGSAIERTLQQGLAAENEARYQDAERFYAKARQMDPADPVPLRYLGELYRHQTGDWDKARQMFQTILNMPADPLSRAIALHGIGKMTIHDGEFTKGLHLMEQSVEAFPTPLAYRNLAVYWHSEGAIAKADDYTRKALALDPQEPFNVVFAAAFMAGSGHADEALKIAREHEDLLCASYNLAAIYAQTGQTEKALSLLKRHFFEYERYQSVRSKEMMEARVDAVFASIVNDPQFVALTADADGKLPMPRR